MNPKPLLFKKGLLCIVALEILIILIIPVKSSGQEIDSNHPSINRQPTLHEDSRILGAIFPIELPRMRGVYAIGIFWLGLGHHDNVTEAKDWTGPKLETSNVYWILHIEAGPVVKRIPISYFLSLRAPIPLTTVIKGYKHRGGFWEHGPLLRMLVLSMKSKVNFIPVIGYRWIGETARIYDAQGINPDSLNLKYRDHGLVFGMDFIVTLSKSSASSQQRLAFGYLYERFVNDRKGADKYRIEWRHYDFFLEKGTTHKINYNDFSYFSLGIEYVRWPGGRNDWFVIGSFGGIGL